MCAQPVPSLTLRLFGPLQFWRNGEEIEHRLGPKTKAILTYVITTTSVRRDHLINWFCGEGKDPQANLRWHLNRIRTWLGGEILSMGGASVHFHPHAASVDVHEFRRLLQGEIAELATKTLEHAVDLYRGPFAGDLAPRLEIADFDFWCQEQSTHYQNLFKTAVLVLVERLRSQNRHNEAQRHALAALQLNNEFAEMHRQLLQIYEETGQEQVAQRHLDRWREFLGDPRRTQEPDRAMTPLVVSRAALHQEDKQERPRADLANASSAFVGRENELATLHQIWSRAQRASGGAILVEAEAGGGKTRLVHEFSHQLGDIAYLRSRCAELMQTTVLEPWIDLLEQCLGRLPPAQVQKLSPFTLTQLSRLLPTLARQTRSVSTSPQQIEEALPLLAAAMLELLAADQTPKVIFLDDLHWADDVSLRVFYLLWHRLARTPPDGTQPRTPLLLIGAYRSEDRFQNRVLSTLCSDLARESVPILVLTALDREAVVQLIALAHPDWSTERRERFAGALVQFTGGNPLFVTEMLNDAPILRDIPFTAPAEGQLAQQLPASLRTFIRQRVTRLDDASRTMVEAMAVYAYPVTVEFATRIAGISPHAAATALDAGVESRLLRAHKDTYPLLFDYSHDLVRAAVLAEMGDAQRRHLHGRIAAVLVDTAAGLQPTEQAAMAGSILHHALRGEALALVVEWAPRAIEFIQQNNAYGRALQLCEEIEEILARSALPVSALDRAQRAQLTLKLIHIELLYRLGRGVDGRPILQEIGDMVGLLPDPALQAQYHLLCAYYSLSDYEEIYTQAQRALHLFQEVGDHQKVGEALWRAGELHIFMSRNADAHRLLGQSLHIYRSIDDVGGEIVALGSLARANLQLGAVATALQHLERALHLARIHEHPYGEFHTCILLAAAWLYFYDVERVHEYARAALSMGDAMGTLSFQLPAHLFISIGYTLQAQYQKAESILVDALAADRSGDRWGRAWCYQILGRICLVGDRLAEAEHWLTQAHDEHRQHNLLQELTTDLAWLARLHGARSAWDAAVQWSQQAVDLLTRLKAQAYPWETHDIYVCHAQTLARVERHDEAMAHVMLAHKSLMHLANQIEHPRARQTFLAHPRNARIVAAAQGDLHALFAPRHTGT